MKNKENYNNNKNINNNNMNIYNYEYEESRISLDNKNEEDDSNLYIKLYQIVQYEPNDYQYHFNNPQIVGDFIFAENLKNLKLTKIQENLNQINKMNKINSNDLNPNNNNDNDILNKESITINGMEINTNTSGVDSNIKVESEVNEISKKLKNSEKRGSNMELNRNGNSNENIDNDYDVNYSNAKNDLNKNIQIINKLDEKEINNPPMEVSLNMNMVNYFCLF